MASTSVFLNVENMARSLAFYQALGFEVEKTYGEGDEVHYADLTLDGAELNIGSIGANDDPGFREWVDAPLGAGVLITFNVDDVDALHGLAVDAGAVVEEAPSDRPYGRACTINDPDGYVISFLTPR